MGKCTDAVTNWMIRCHVIHEEDKELYKYAIHSFFLLLSPLILAGGIGFCVGSVKHGFAVILPFIVLRKFSGGYHAKNLHTCILGSGFLLLLCIICSIHVQCDWRLAITTAIASVSLIVFSPMDSENSNFDLIHVHDYFLLNALELILKKINIPVVATVHAINDFPNHFGEGMRNYMLRNATNVIVVSEWLRDVVLERFQFMHPEVIQVIANGVSMPDEMQNISGNHNNYITFSGRLEYKKGVDILINAYATALEKDETLPDLVIMGDGTGRRNFVKIAQELGISHRVHFTGMISNLDVHQNLINSAMHVVPSLAEPFGITAIESMLDGTPVIASNSGGLKEIVEDEKTGLLVSPGDVDMLASAILRLWQHPELRKKLAGASIEKARNVYTWENVSAFTRNVYTQAIANGNGC